MLNNPALNDPCTALARKCQRQEKEIEKLRAIESAARRVLETVFFFGDSAADLRAALDAVAHFDANTQTAENLERYLKSLPAYEAEEAA